MKRGELILSETIGVVVAVIGIGIFSTVIVGVFFLGTEGDQDNARVVIDSIEERINNLEDGQTARFVVRTPCSGQSDSEIGDCEWFVTGWAKRDVGKSDRCRDDSCVCVCDGDCENFGLCRNIDEDELEVERVDLRKPLIELEISKQNESIKIGISGA